MSSHSVSGKTAVITGAGSGINYCFARLLLEKGCNVLIADLGLRPEAEQLIHQYKDKTRAVFHKCDVTEWSQLDQLLDVAHKEFGQVDIVCPGAGVFEPPWSNFWQPPGISPSAKDTVQNSRYKILDINLIHPIRLSQVAITYFASHNRPGSIIHISSIAGQWPIFPTPMYSASKHAISGFVRSISALANPPSGSGVKPIRVVAVAPGVIKTPLWTDHPEKLKFVDESKDVWVSPEEVAEGMFSVLTDEGKYESGTILEIGKGTRREVKMINDPGFSGVGMTVSELGKGVDEVWASLGGMGKH